MREDRRDNGEEMFALGFGNVDKENKRSNVKAAATIIINRGLSPTVDYLAVNPRVKDNGFGTILISCAIIMGLVCGSLHPSVLLVTDITTAAYSIYTRSLGFRMKDWGRLLPHFVSFAANCGYIRHDNIKPLYRTGLIVKVGEVSPIHGKEQISTKVPSSWEWELEEKSRKKSIM